MKQHVGLTAVVVEDYDDAIDFYTKKLGFTLVDDTYQPEQDKRWVVVAPPGAKESRILLARAVGEEQLSRVGNQTGGRVFLFLYTDDFARDYLGTSLARLNPEDGTVVRPASRIFDADDPAVLRAVGRVKGRGRRLLAHQKLEVAAQLLLAIGGGHHVPDRRQIGIRER